MKTVRKNEESLFGRIAQRIRSADQFIELLCRFWSEQIERAYR